MKGMYSEKHVGRNNADLHQITFMLNQHTN